MGQRLKEGLTRDELLQLLNFELAAYEQCGGCHFAAIDLLPGAEWSAHLEDEGGVELVQYCIARSIVEQTQKAFALR
jgi:hypothetical protein